MTGHTPGPWMIFPDGDIGSASVRRPDTTVIRAGTIKGETIGVAMANARLIAAAPDLLEFAANYLLSQDDCIRNGDTHGCECVTCVLNRTARAAIAKAGGAL